MDGRDTDPKSGKDRISSSCKTIARVQEKWLHYGPILCHGLTENAGTVSRIAYDQLVDGVSERKDNRVVIFSIHYQISDGIKG